MGIGRIARKNGDGALLGVEISLSFAQNYLNRSIFVPNEETQF
jgi:hypothetical protein